MLAGQAGAFRVPLRRLRWMALLALALGVVAASLGASTALASRTDGFAANAAFARMTAARGAALGARTAAAEAEPGNCIIHTLPSFTESGEFATSSSVADVVEVECQPVFAEEKVKVTSEELYSRCDHGLVWSLPYPYAPEKGPGFTMTLDNDGNATAVLWGGPSCAAGESLISAHLEAPPYTTVTTGFSVLPPRPTAEGVWASPESEVEDEVTSSVATIVGVEFPAVYAEKTVDINAEQLYSRCAVAPHLVWVGPDGVVLAEETGTVSVKLDNDGNAFVVALGGASCASGWSEIEASLEEAPYTTATTSFTIVPPEPTVGPAPEPKFTIEKLQKISGEFVKSELGGKLGEVVHYEIIVTNTGNIPLKFSHFSDPNCTNIAGGPTEAVKPGESTTYTCEHTLTSYGKYVNEASVEGNEEAGPKKSNKVVVNVLEPGFTIEKKQKISGAFTTAPLTGRIGQTVYYEIIVTNTGEVPLEFSHFSDPNCTNIAGGPTGPVKPGESTTFTCEHPLEAVGTWTNVATVEGNEGTGKRPSNEVMVNVLPALFTIEKKQKISGEFTTEPLKGKLGEIVQYEIIVTNTGEVPLEFSNFSDPNCTNIAGGPTGPVKPGESTTFTCEHKLEAVGTWGNVATIEGNEGAGKRPSKEVVVEVLPPAEYTIKKLQKISPGGFTEGEVTGMIGETIDYEIIVTNTGEATLTFSNFSDPNCTNLAGGPTGPLKTGESATYTCEHTLESEGKWTNVATIESSEGPPARTKESNTVAATVPPVLVPLPELVVIPPTPLPKIEPKGVCLVVAHYALYGAVGPKRKAFKVTVTAKGLQKITFYIDHRKVKTLTHAQAKNGLFTITVKLHGLHVGTHRLSFKTVAKEPTCKSASGSSVFVVPKGAVEPEFTG